MGVFRFFLAYVVLISHCPVGELNRWFHPALAVQCFFIISGFYMQLLVSEKYAGQDPTKFYKDFYLSRIFRIFPVYWVILLITIIFVERGSISNLIDNFDVKGIFIYFFTNVFILGQSVLRFFDYDSGELFLQGKNVVETISPEHILIFYQTWSLDLELIFYILAPFLLCIKKTQIIIYIILFSILLRFLFAQNGYNYSIQWAYNNEFFPFELATFLLGSLSYRTYYFFKNILLNIEFNIDEYKFPQVNISLYMLNIVFYFYILYCIYDFLTFDPFNNYIFGLNIGGVWEQGLFGVPNSYFLILLYCAIFTPILFDLSKDFKIDSFIGKLSYPLYLCHTSIIYFVLEANIEEHLVGIYTLVFSTIFSIILVLFIDNPITKYRHKKFYKN
jgi:peptidoglycan/LPS O-acetylase OafA/YrhL